MGDRVGRGDREADSISGSITGCMLISLGEVPQDRNGGTFSLLILGSCHSSGIKYAGQTFLGWQALLTEGRALLTMD